MTQSGHLRGLRLAGTAAAVAVLLGSLGYAQAQGSASSKAQDTALPGIEANRNLAPAGQLQGGVLTLRLEIREGNWYPEAAACGFFSGALAGGSEGPRGAAAGAGDRTRGAVVVIVVGETYDFEFAPITKGDLRLEVLRPRNRTLAVAEVQVR